MSPKKGRPKVEETERKDIRFSIRLDEALNLQLDKYCQIHKEKKAEVIRKAIVSFLGEK